VYIACSTNVLLYISPQRLLLAVLTHNYCKRQTVGWEGKCALHAWIQVNPWLY